MDSLPPNVIAEVIKRADVPIDTRLHYREYGWAAKPVVIPEGLDAKLRGICKKRTEGYAKYRRQNEESPFRWSMQLNQEIHRSSEDEDVFVEMIVTDVEDRIELTVKITRFYASLRLFQMKWSNYNLLTGGLIDSC